MLKRNPRLCIVAPWVYPLFNARNDSHFGGWEVRMASISKGLAARGFFQVSVVTGDHGQPHVERHSGLSLYSWKGREIWGIPRQSPTNSRIRRLWQRLKPATRSTLPAGEIGSYLIRPDMIEIYDEIQADVYTVPGNSQFSGELAYYCSQRGKPYVFMAGSDMDLYPEYKAEPDRLDIYSVPYCLKTYAIEMASAHILQNEGQAGMLRAGYGLTGRVIRNPIDLRRQYPKSESPSGILWVGKSDERVKRPSLVFELARRMPGMPFTIILNRGIPETHTACLAEAAGLPNVLLIERVPFDEIERFFAEAALFVNTSAFEGFPNTFLQAAKYGVPIVASDVDPGAMLSEHGCGATCGGDFEQFVASVKSLMSDAEVYAKRSAAALRYVHAHHDENVVLSEYEDAFRAALEGWRFDRTNRGPQRHR